MIGRWKRYRVTGALVVAAALLAGVAYWDRDRISTEEASSRKLQLFEAWRPDEVDTLLVEGANVFHSRMETASLPPTSKRSKTSCSPWNTRASSGASKGSTERRSDSIPRSSS